MAKLTVSEVQGIVLLVWQSVQGNSMHDPSTTKLVGVVTGNTRKECEEKFLKAYHVQRQTWDWMSSFQKAKVYGSLKEAGLYPQYLPEREKSDA